MTMNDMNGAALFRLIGMLAVCVAAMWAWQVLDFGAAGASISRLTWVLGAASIAGTGVGLIVVSTGLPATRSKA